MFSGEQFLTGWFVLGIVAFIIMGFVCYYEGDDLYLKDAWVVVVLIFLGPISLIIELCFYISNTNSWEKLMNKKDALVVWASSYVLIKGKKSKE